MKWQNQMLRVLLSAVLLLPLMGAAQKQNQLSTSVKPESKTSGGRKSGTKSTAAQPGNNPWDKIKVPPLHAFHPQHPKRIEFSNGLVVFLQEDHELPLIDGTIRIRGGSRDEPAGKTGLASVYGHAWRLGGTTSKTGDELDDFLEARAAKVETSSTVDSSLLSWS